MNLYPPKATLPIAIFIFASILSTPNFAQQHIIANKDNTRPEASRQFNTLSKISHLTAVKYTGYNDISWSAIIGQNATKYFVEYSFDGNIFQPAGQVLSANGIYNMKHYSVDSRPVLYRVRMEGTTGNLLYSDAILIGGTGIEPVKIYPTQVTGNVINANAGFPVERLIILSSDGQQMFAKDLNGVRDFIPINIPSLNRGMYFITFYGNGWKSTSKFIIG